MDVRLTGLSRALFDLLPPGLEPLYFAVTLLGDTLVVTGLLALLYWAYRDRRATLTAVGYGFVGFGAIVALKGFFAAPRPEAALIPAHGYGFPSGHALGATVVYGGLAMEHGWFEDRRKAAGIGVLVAAVAFSRVALRVHYLGDVLVGTVLGVALLLATRGLAKGSPRYTFAVAAWLAVPALYVTGGSADAWGVLGGAVGGLLAAAYLSAAPERGSLRETAALVAVGLPLVGATKLAAEALPAVPGAAGLDELVIVLVVVLLPVGFERAGVRTYLTE